MRSFLSLPIRLLVTAAVAALCASTLFAQQSTLGGITGDVTDPSGSVISNATVTVVDEQTSLTRTVTISADARTLGTIHVAENPNYSFSHKNKYGEDYVPAPDQGYQHP